jgi:hypothetical protein
VYACTHKWNHKRHLCTTSKAIHVFMHSWQITQQNNNRYIYICIHSTHPTPSLCTFALLCMSNCSNMYIQEAPCTLTRVHRRLLNYRPACNAKHHKGAGRSAMRAAPGLQ